MLKYILQDIIYTFIFLNFQASDYIALWLHMFKLIHKLNTSYNEESRYNISIAGSDLKRKEKCFQILLPNAY